MIQVGGYEPCTVTDFEVPKQFGLRQTIADTLGIGGIMRGLRTIPVLLDMCADMEELCPDVWFLNYTNPMAINCRAVHAGLVDPDGRAVPQRAGDRVRVVDRPRHPVPRDRRIVAAGINHMAFYLRFARDGEDLYPRLHGARANGRRPGRRTVCATRC